MKLKYVSVALVLTFLLSFLVACSSPTTPTPEPTPTLPSLPAGQWTAFSPGGDTICADGSAYTYYVRPGTVNKLVVDFEGGGACWSGETCSGSVYKPNISAAPSAEYREDDPTGMYDHANPANPVGDWYHVFVSYCTADIHLGDSVETYETSSGPIKINHNGQKNVTSVLSWVEDNFSAPEAVFVTGCSAGAYGAALYTSPIAEAYPDADVTELGDCGAGIIPDDFVMDEDGLKRWNIEAVLPKGVNLTDGVPATFLADAYVAIGEAHPDVTLAQYNSLYDGTQIFFYTLQLGLDPNDERAQEAARLAWVAGLNASLGKIQAQLPGRFASYTSLLETDDEPGTDHCVIFRPEFYTLATSGVSFVDWLDSLLNDDTPPALVVPDDVPTPS